MPIFYNKTDVTAGLKSAGLSPKVVAEEMRSSATVMVREPRNNGVPYEGLSLKDFLKIHPNLNIKDLSINES